MKRFSEEPIPWLILGFFLLFSGGVGVYALTRGLRNNNPGNIALTSPPTPWQGWVGAAAQTDQTFVQFTDATYGIRALAHVLINYYSGGYQTVTDIITRYAPPTENDTASYISNVASALGVDPSAILNLTDGTTLPALVSAIIKQENGLNPYSSDTIAQGIAA